MVSTSIIVAFLLIVGFTLVTKNVGIGILVTAIILLIYKLINRKDIVDDDDFYRL